MGNLKMNCGYCGRKCSLDKDFCIPQDSIYICKSCYDWKQKVANLETKLAECEQEKLLNSYGMDRNADIAENYKQQVAKLEIKLAEERKKVVQELKSWCDKNFNWVGDGTGYDGQDYNEMIGSNNTINKLREFLNQIQGDDNNENKKH